MSSKKLAVDWHHRCGILLVFAAASSFAFKGILAKLSYQEGITITALLLIRFLIATPLFWIAPTFISKKANISKLTKSDFLLCVVSGLLFFISAFTDFKAISLIDVGIERVIFFSYPVFIILLNSLITRRLPLLSHIYVFVVIEFGIMLIMGFASKENIFKGNIEGTLWAMCAAISYAFYLMMGQQIMKKIGSIPFTIIANTATFIFLLLQFLLFSSISELSVSGLGLFYILLIALFCTVIPFFMVFEGIQRIGATKAALISMTGPVVTIFASHFLLKEKLDHCQIIGVFLVLGGIALLEGHSSLKKFLNYLRE